MDALIPAHEASVQPDPAPVAGPPNGGIDVAAFVRRYLLLLTFCMLCGVALGILYYQKTPPIYASKSDVLIENQRSTSISQDMYGYAGNEKTIDTHVLIIQSPLIIERALKQLEISQYPGLGDAKSPVDIIGSSLDVKVEGNSSSVMSLSYSGGNATECRDVLAAVVNAYGDFLGESSRNIGDETTSLITEAKDVLMGQLRAKREKYDAFRQGAPLIWKDGKGVNPHRERQMDVEKKRSELLVENSTLRAKLRNTLEALRSGGERRRAVYYEALKEINPDAKTNVDAHAEASQRLFVAALTDEYVKLRAEEHSLATKYGDGHPELADLRNRLASLRESLGLSEDADPSFSQPSESDNESQIDYISIYVNMLNDRLATVEGQVEELNQIYNDEKEKANSLQSFQIQDEEIREDLAATQRLFDAVVSRLEEINIISEYGGDKMDVLATAKLGTRVAPLLLTCVIPGALVGLIAGCGLSYLMERSAAMFRSPAEIRTALNVPVIGRIPVVERKNQKTPDEFSNVSPILCTVHRQGSSMAEAYRAVRTSLLYSVGGQNHQVIQVTSPLPGDGKSTVVANLAVTLAKSGKRVVLVDADFRRPTLHKLFGIDSPTIGLVSVVRDGIESELAVIETEIPNVSLLPVNERAQNPAELLSNPNFKAILERLRQQYDFVLVDTPPLLAVTDPSAVAAQVDGVLLVMRIRRGVQVAATRAREMLADVDSNVLGAIVNAVDKKSSYGSYGYGYGYGYGFGYGYGYTSEDGDNSVRRTNRPTAKRLMVDASHVVN